MNSNLSRVLTILASIAAGLVMTPTAVLAEEVTVRGCLEYGTIDETLETTDEARSIFDRGLADGEPIQFVTVGLYRQYTDLLAGEDITDEEGCFSITVTQTPNTLRVKAKNDYVNVKRAKLLALATDNAISVDFSISGDEYDGGDVNLGTKVIDDSDHTFDAQFNTYPVSRAMFVATSVHRAATHINEAAGAHLESVWVRLGYWSTPWYDRYLVGSLFEFLAGNPETIHLPGDQAAVIDHEYGHFIEDSIGAFGVVPSYLLQFGRDNAHYNCREHNLLNGSDPDFCWSFIEGLASWYGAVNSFGFASVSDVPFFPLVDGDGDGNSWEEDDLLVTLGDNWWVENSNDACTATDRGSWSEPRAVESVVAQVMWDLVDGHQDSTDALGSGVPEVAEVPIEDILDILRKDIPTHQGCAWITMYSHPVTLEEFCDEYVDTHRNDTEHHVFPDLYAAYAFNGVAVDCARDSGSPDPVSVASSTHPAGQWRNTTQVNGTITDGDDDFSGSYYYWMTWDNDPDTEVDGTTAAIGTESTATKATEQSLSVSRPEGDQQYLHVQTRDLAGNLGTTAHYGPVRIDLTPPYFLSTDFPAPGSQFVIGKFVHIEWQARDDLSGVNYVTINYADAANGISYTAMERLDASVSTFELYLSPDLFLPTSTAVFSLTAVDKAGNTATQVAAAVTLVSPFSGPYGFGLAPEFGRVVSGDLDGDGKDEFVMSGAVLGAGVLKVIKVSPVINMQNVVPGLSGGDLFLADTDRDGDLDLVAAGDFGGASPEIYLYENNGLGTLTSLGPLPLPGFHDMVVRVVDLNGTGEPILVYGGRRTPIDAKLLTYNFATGVADVLDDIEFRGGDFEVGDINGDEYLDFVTLGFGSAGTGSMIWYEGTNDSNEQGWTPVGGRAGLTILEGDVDLGNWDTDSDLDLFAMYRVHDGVASKDYTELREWWQPGFYVEAEAAGRNRIAEGDGHVVEIYNDGWADVLALGRQVDGDLSSWHETNSLFGQRGSGVPVPVSSDPLYDTDTAWGDFDGDRDLDFVVVGRTAAGASRSHWYMGRATQNGDPNADPPAPAALASEYDPVAGGYTFKWNAPPVSTDETAKAAFRYELRVGTAPGANDILTWAHPAALSQQVAGLAYGNRVERFVPLALGTYYWSVRTVDTGWRRSVPAAERSTASAIICTNVPGDCDADGVRDACETNTDGDAVIDDCDPDDDNDGVPDTADTDRLDPYACGDGDLDGCDDCAGGDGFGLGPDFNPMNDGPDHDFDGLCDSGDPCPVDTFNDSDLDGVCDSADVCPGGADGIDSDLDGAADACDPCPLDSPDDSDGDGLCDSEDVCAGGDDRLDGDGDGLPDACDPCPLDVLGDSDGDGNCDSDDLCLAGDDRVDADGDTVADACDPCPIDNPDDSDSDLVCDTDDICPGGDDTADRDGDGVPDRCDNCPDLANSDQRNSDGDAQGDVCDSPGGGAEDGTKFIKRRR